MDFATKLRLARAATRAKAEPSATTRAQPRFKGTRRTIVEGLVLLCRVGIYPKERLRPQRVQIDVELTSPEPENRLSDRIADVVCYEKLVRRIQEIAQGPHVKLVETLAGRIADHCCAELPIERVVVRVRKLDVMPEAKSVGVEVERVAPRKPK